MLFQLKGAGDLHSFYFSPVEYAQQLTTPTGFGLLLLGQRVLQVNQGGPAGRAEIVAGDEITAVDGQSIYGPDPAVDLAVVVPEATVTVTVRPGQGDRNAL